jgi:hypothetical protein
MPGDHSRDLREDIRFVELQARVEETAELLLAKFQMDGLDPDAARDEVFGRCEKVVRCVRGPAFDEDGFLPPIQVCTEAEVVRWFGFNEQRWGLVDRIRKWISLARAVRARRLLLDGSFVTEKESPGDVDAAILLPDDFQEQLLAGDAKAIELHSVLLTGEPKELFAAEDEQDWWGWFGFFSQTREANGRYKGLIEVAL